MHETAGSAGKRLSPAACSNACKPLDDRRAAFTLVELMATIAIIGLLVALLVPAIQSARESSRRASCSGNLRQIGTALAQYANAMQDLLPGGEMHTYWTPSEGGTPVNYYHGSLTMYLLPYIGQQMLYDRYDMQEPVFQIINGMSGVPGLAAGAVFNNGAATLPGSTQAVCSVRISTYECPSDPPGPIAAEIQRYQGWARARLNYIGSVGPDTMSAGAVCPATINALNNAASANLKRLTGSIRKPGMFGYLLYTAVSRLPQVTQLVDARCRIATVRDGMSNTIAMGEALPDCAFGLFFGWGIVGNLSGSGNTLVPINYNTCDPTPTAGDASDCGRPLSGGALTKGFRSRHPSGAMFLMGDGVVKFIGDGIDFTTFQRLGAKADGEVLDPY